MSERMKPESDPAKCRAEMWRLWRACDRASVAIGETITFDAPIDAEILVAAADLADAIDRATQREGRQ